MELMRRFDPEKRKLCVHGREFFLTEGTVNWLMGLPLGVEEIKIKRADGVSKGEKDKKRKCRDVVIEELNGAVEEDEWKAKILFLAFKYVLGPTSSNYSNKSSSIFGDIVGYVRDKWRCELVLERLCEGARSLKAQLSKHERGEKVTLALKGCSLLLEVFYAEHIDCNFIETEVGKRKSPRLSDWTDERIKKDYKKVKNFDNNSVELSHGYALGVVCVRFVSNTVGDNHEARIKNLEDLLRSKEKESQMLAETVKEQQTSIVALQGELQDVRDIVKFLQGKLEEKAEIGTDGVGAHTPPIDDMSLAVFETEPIPCKVANKEEVDSSSKDSKFYIRRAKITEQKQITLGLAAKESWLLVMRLFTNQLKKKLSPGFKKRSVWNE